MTPKRAAEIRAGLRECGDVWLEPGELGELIYDHAEMLRMRTEIEETSADGKHRDAVHVEACFALAERALELTAERDEIAAELAEHLLTCKGATP